MPLLTGMEADTIGNRREGVIGSHAARCGAASATKSCLRFPPCRSRVPRRRDAKGDISRCHVAHGELEYAARCITHRAAEDGAIA